MKKSIVWFEDSDLEAVGVDAASLPEEDKEMIADKVSDLILLNYDKHIVQACLEVGVPVKE